MICEKELYKSKWWDYRLILPRIADLEFAKAYVEALREDGRGKGYGDDDEIKNAWLCETDFVMEDIDDFRTKITGRNELKRLRVFCDKHCMRYGAFWFYAFKVLNDMKGRGNPVRRAISPFVRHCILHHHKIRCDESIQRSRHSFFRAENFKWHSVQVDYYRYLYGAVLEKYGDRRGRDLLSLLIGEGEIHEDFIKQETENNKNDRPLQRRAVEVNRHITGIAQEAESQGSKRRRVASGTDGDGVVVIPGRKQGH